MELHFRIGDAFPATDPLAQWVAVLALISNDLREVVAVWGTRSQPGQSLYYFRLMNGHLREAVKFLCLHRPPEVVRHISDLPAPTRVAYDRIVAQSEPFKGSFLMTHVAPIRDTCFHYPLDGDAQRQLRTALSRVAELPGALAFSDSDRSFRLEFADQVALHLAVPALAPGEAGQAEFEALVAQLRDLAMDVIWFADEVVMLYVMEFRARVAGTAGLTAVAPPRRP